MRRSQEVIGLSVIHLKTGKKLGVVQDILFDQKQQLCGLLLEDGGWLRRRRVVLKDNIEAMGPDAVVIKSESQIGSFDERTIDWMGICSGHKKLKGLPVLLTSGTELGVIQNVYFLEEVGTLVGYELSDGLVSDLIEGRKVLKANAPLLWGQDVLIASQDRVRVEKQM